MSQSEQEGTGVEAGDPPPEEPASEAASQAREDDEAPALQAAYREALPAPETAPPGKSIVLCLDGTGNEYGKRNTNVVLLNRVVQRSERQLVYYDPGVGTASIKPTLTSFARAWQRAIGLAFGYGLAENVIEAYRFIMNTAEPGDTVYLFGFSRGAYTARVVAALIHGIGLLPRGHDHLIASALKALRSDGFDRKRLLGFRRQFSRHDAQGELIRPRIMLGLWDTVSSVSWVFDEVSYRYTTRNPSVCVARHAVALDERRAFFRTNLLKAWRRLDENEQEVSRQDLKQVWFAGVHSDVGGGYPMGETGLAKLALEWMLCEAQDYGLRFTEEAEPLLYPGERDAAGQAAPIVPTVCGTAPVAPDPLGPRHNQLSGLWWACEFWPKRPWDPRKRRPKLHFNLARRRWVPTSKDDQRQLAKLDFPLPVIHESAVQRKQTSTYEPKNWPASFAVEERRRFELLAAEPAPEEVAPRARPEPSPAEPAPQDPSPKQESAKEPLPLVLPAILVGYLVVTFVVFAGRGFGLFPDSGESAFKWPVTLVQSVRASLQAN